MMDCFTFHYRLRRLRAAKRNVIRADRKKYENAQKLGNADVALGR